MHIKKIVARLKVIEPFSSFKKRALIAFAGLSEVNEYKTGTIIYKAGDGPDYFYLILSGRVEAVTTISGASSVIECLKRGVSFGIISVLTDENHSVTMKAIENSLILRVRKDDFKDFTRKYPQILLTFTKMLSSRVKKRSQPKEIFQSKRIAICDFSSHHDYVGDLAGKLKEITKKKVVLVKFIPLLDSALNERLSLDKKYMVLSDFAEESINEYLSNDEVSVLRVRVDATDKMAALFNCLSEGYHYIVCDVCREVWKDHTAMLGSLTHYIHFFLSLNKRTVYENISVMNQMKKKLNAKQIKIKTIVADSGEANIDIRTRRKNLPFPVRIMVPDMKNNMYWRAVEALCREIGGLSIGIALGSGAAYGYSHIGVIAELTRNDVPIDLISGTSMGALIAALWAAGYSIEQIKNHAEEFGKVISKYPLWQLAIPFKGLLKARRLERVLKSIFGNLTFYELRYSLKIVAFNFVKREIQVFNNGLVYKAVAASCAMPAIFEPIKIDGQMFFDGGILSPLPVYPLLEAGINKVIAVNVTPSREEMSREYKRRTKLSIFDFIFGSIETMQQEFISHELRIADIVIHPDLSGLGWMEFDKTNEFIARGKTATNAVITEIQKI